MDYVPLRSKVSQKGTDDETSAEILQPGSKQRQPAPQYSITIGSIPAAQLSSGSEDSTSVSGQRQNTSPPPKTEEIKYDNLYNRRAPKAAPEALTVPDEPITAATPIGVSTQKRTPASTRNRQPKEPEPSPLRGDLFPRPATGNTDSALGRRGVAFATSGGQTTTDAEASRRMIAANLEGTMQRLKDRLGKYNTFRDAIRSTPTATTTAQPHVSGAGVGTAGGSSQLPHNASFLVSIAQQQKGVISRDSQSAASLFGKGGSYHHWGDVEHLISGHHSGEQQRLPVLGARPNTVDGSAPSHSMLAKRPASVAYSAYSQLVSAFPRPPPNGAPIASQRRSTTGGRNQMNASPANTNPLATLDLVSSVATIPTFELIGHRAAQEALNSNQGGGNQNSTDHGRSSSPFGPYSRLGRGSGRPGSSPSSQPFGGDLHGDDYEGGGSGTGSNRFQLGGNIGTKADSKAIHYTDNLLMNTLLAKYNAQERSKQQQQEAKEKNNSAWGAGGSHTINGSPSTLFHLPSRVGSADPQHPQGRAGPPGSESDAAALYGRKSSIENSSASGRPPTVPTSIAHRHSGSSAYTLPLMDPTQSMTKRQQLQHEIDHQQAGTTSVAASNAITAESRLRHQRAGNGSSYPAPKPPQPSSNDNDSIPPTHNHHNIAINQRLVREVAKATLNGEATRLTSDPPFLLWLSEHADASEESIRGEARRRHNEIVERDRAARATYLSLWTDEMGKEIATLAEDGEGGWEAVEGLGFDVEGGEYFAYEDEEAEEFEEGFEEEDEEDGSEDQRSAEARVDGGMETIVAEHNPIPSTGPRRGRRGPSATTFTDHEEPLITTISKTSIVAPIHSPASLTAQLSLSNQMQLQQTALKHHQRAGRFLMADLAKPKLRQDRPVSDDDAEDMDAPLPPPRRAAPLAPSPPPSLRAGRTPAPPSSNGVTPDRRSSYTRPHHQNRSSLQEQPLETIDDPALEASAVSKVLDLAEEEKRSVNAQRLAWEVFASGFPASVNDSSKGEQHSAKGVASPTAPATSQAAHHKRSEQQSPNHKSNTSHQPRSPVLVKVGGYQQTLRDQQRLATVDRNTMSPQSPASPGHSPLHASPYDNLVADAENAIADMDLPSSPHSAARSPMSSPKHSPKTTIHATAFVTPTPEAAIDRRIIILNTNDEAERGDLRQWLNAGWATHTHRHEEAALRIQCCGRVFIAKKRVQLARYRRRELTRLRLAAEERNEALWTESREASLREEELAAHRRTAAIDDLFEDKLKLKRKFEQTLVAKIHHMRKVRERRERERSELVTYAATRIQSIYRGFIARRDAKYLRQPELLEAKLAAKRNKAALKIQRRFRGHLARSKIEERQIAALHIQSAFRQFLARGVLRSVRAASKASEEEKVFAFAAVIIQRRYRAYLRQKVFNEMLQNGQLGLLHRIGKGFLGRRHTHVLAQRRSGKGFVGMQAALRARQSRRTVLTKYLRRVAATKIQALFRRLLARKALLRKKAKASNDKVAEKQKDSATVIQAWWRGIDMRRTPSPVISATPTSRFRREAEEDNANRSGSSERAPSDDGDEEKQLAKQQVKEDAALIVQTALRNHLASKELATRQAEAAAQVQKEIRHDAAVIIQSFYRVNIRQRKLYAKVTSAARVVQRSLQVHRAQKRVAKLRAQAPKIRDTKITNDAAIIIQKAYRCYLAKKRVQVAIDARKAQQLCLKQEEAALMIQAFLRGASQKSKFKIQMEEHKSSIMNGTSVGSASTTITAPELDEAVARELAEQEESARGQLLGGEEQTRVEALQVPWLHALIFEGVEEACEAQQRGIIEADEDSQRSKISHMAADDARRLGDENVTRKIESERLAREAKEAEELAAAEAATKAKIAEEQRVERYDVEEAETTSRDHISTEEAKEISQRTESVQKAIAEQREVEREAAELAAYLSRRHEETVFDNDNTDQAHCYYDTADTIARMVDLEPEMALAKISETIEQELSELRRKRVTSKAGQELMAGAPPGTSVMSNGPAAPDYEMEEGSAMDLDFNDSDSRRESPATKLEILPSNVALPPVPEEEHASTTIPAAAPTADPGGDAINDDDDQPSTVGRSAHEATDLSLTDNDEAEAEPGAEPKNGGEGEEDADDPFADVLEESSLPPPGAPPASEYKPVVQRPESASMVAPAPLIRPATAGPAGPTPAPPPSQTTQPQSSQEGLPPKPSAISAVEEAARHQPDETDSISLGSLESKGLDDTSLTWGSVSPTGSTQADPKEALALNNKSPVSKPITPVAQTASAFEEVPVGTTSPSVAAPQTVASPAAPANNKRQVTTLRGGKEADPGTETNTTSELFLGDGDDEDEEDDENGTHFSLGTTPAGTSTSMRKSLSLGQSAGIFGDELPLPSSSGQKLEPLPPAAANAKGQQPDSLESSPLTAAPKVSATTTVGISRLAKANNDDTTSSVEFTNTNTNTDQKTKESSGGGGAIGPGAAATSTAPNNKKASEDEDTDKLSLLDDDADDLLDDLSDMEL